MSSNIFQNSKNLDIKESGNRVCEKNGLKWPSKVFLANNGLNRIKVTTYISNILYLQCIFDLEFNKIFMFN